MERLEALFNEIKETIGEDVELITEDLSEEVYGVIYSTFLEIAIIDGEEGYIVDFCLNSELIPSDVAFFMSVLAEHFDEEFENDRVHIHNFTVDGDDRIYGEEAVKSYFKRMNKSLVKPTLNLNTLSQPILPEHIGYYSSHDDGQYDITTKQTVLHTTKLNEDSESEGDDTPPIVNYQQFFLKYR